MRTRFLCFLLALGALLFAAPAWAADIELFTRAGCPRCVEAKTFVLELEKTRPGVTVVVFDVSQDAAALARLESLAAASGAVSVPAFHVRDQLIVGWGPRTGERVIAALDGGTTAEHSGETCAAHEPCDAIDAPVVGRVSVRDLGLPLFTVVIGLIDGFNPCAMWVLLFLLSVLAGMKNRKKMLLVSGVFVLVSAAAYYAFMAAWLNVFMLVGVSRAAQLVLGGVAIAVGAIHVKDFFAFKKGISLSIPERAKPTIYARVRAVVQAEHVAVALASAAALAVLVNAVELLCTAGLPALYTEILVSHGLPAWKRYAYLGLYDLAYMADDTVMVGIAVVTLGRKKLQERGGRVLKLVSGATMLVLGALLLVKPEWLSF